MAIEAPDPSVFDAIFKEEEQLRALMLEGMGLQDDGVEPLSILDEEELVERVYPLPGTTSEADAATHKGHTQYLIDRYDGKDSGSRGSVGTVVEDYTVSRPESRGLLFNRHARAAIIMGAMVTTLVANLNNLGTAAEDLGDEIKQGVYELHHLVDGDSGTHTETIRADGKVTVLDREFVFKSGSHKLDQDDVAEFIGDVTDMVHRGQKVDISIGGSASDERNTRSSVAVHDEANDVLAMERQEILETVLEKAFASEDVAVQLSKNVASEDILPSQEAGIIDDMLVKEQLSFKQALAMFNKNPGSLPTKLRALFAVDLGAKRSATATVVAKAPDQLRTVEVSDPAELPPTDPTRPYDWNLWPLVGAALTLTPRFGWRKELRNRERLVRLPERKPDETWVKLRKEAWAHQPEGQPSEIVDYDANKKAWVLAPEEYRLKHGAWKYSRKVDVLMREERLQNALTHEYIADDGERKSVHILFVDHRPNAETLGIMVEELEKATLMRKGQSPRFEALMLYPQENAGLHGNPKRIGLGVDEQYGTSTLGVAIPTLGLAEAQIKTDPTREELQQFFGAMWTVNHEVHGHHSDVIEGLPLLKPVRGFDNYFTVSNPWVDAAKDSFDEFPDVNAQVMVKGPWWKRAFKKSEIVPREFEIEYGVADKSSTVTSITERIKEDDPAFSAMLARSRSVRLIGRKPTDYAGTNASELHAETAAQATTGLPIPFSEAKITINRTGALADVNLANGYGVDPALLERYAERVGASIGPDKMLYWPPSKHRDSVVRYGAIKDDPILGEIYRDAKETALPPDSELITILTRVTRLDGDKQAV